MLRIAVIGDRFITAELVIEAIRTQLEPSSGPATVRTMQLEWPEDTPIGNEEVQEFVGDPAAIASFVGDAQVVVTQVAPISRQLIEGAPDLQIIAVARGGPVNVNVAAATARGIPIAFAPGSNAQAVAEFTMGLLLAESKHITRAHNALAQGNWRVDGYHYKHAPSELRGQTVGIIGFGNVGQLMMPYLLAFGLRVLVFDPYVSAQTCAHMGAHQVELATLLCESDIVTMCARVTPETRGMIGSAQFAMMKPGAIFINSARGPLVDYDALYAALASGHLGGAALDTYAIEPPPADWPLLKLDNVTLTPHIAGSSREGARRRADMIMSDVANFYAGRPLTYCMNPEVMARQSAQERDRA